jgi:two-component system chemotaxis response regulator CheV
MQTAQESRILLETGTNELEVLELFILHRETPESEPEPRYFGINVAKVMQVIEDPGLVPPESGSHHAFLGLISLRERTVPVLDLAAMLGFQRARAEYEVVIVTEFSQAVTGFLVSGVTDIHRLGWQQVEPPDKFLESAARGVIVGMVDMEDRFVQILDMESLLAEIDPETVARAGETDVRASRPYKALVADDSATIRVMLRKLLEAAGFEPVLVNTGEEAIKYLDEAKKRMRAEERPREEFVDILIADIEMPRVDGYSLTKHVKEDPDLGGMPVILYSSIIYDEVLHKGASVKADKQVSKPEMHRMAELALELLEGGEG